jgi:flagella basal body P-ring formation protein FlgA
MIWHPFKSGWLGLLCWSSLALTAAAAEAPTTLAAAAERFAESALKLPGGSVTAVMINSQLPLGPCPYGWQWSFAFNTQNTVKAHCPGITGPDKFVSLRLPLPTEVKVRPTTTAVVLNRDLPYGHALTADDLSVKQLAASSTTAGNALGNPDDLVGKSLTRNMRAGDSIGRADIQAMLVVRRNDSVTGWSYFSGGRVGSKLIALQDGRAGQRIDLENPLSKRKVRGEIQADGTVRLGMPGTSSTQIAENPKVRVANVDWVGMEAGKTP